MGQGFYDIKRGQVKNIEGGKLGEVLRSSFGNSKDLGGGKFEATVGPMVVTTWIEGKDKLRFDSNQPTKIDDETATKVIRARNQFLDAATGFNFKQRKARATKAVTGADE